MESSLASQSPDTSDVRPSFRKPSNDASHRKYRRHSPVSRSASPSSNDSPKHERSFSPNASQGEVTKTGESARRGRRTDGERDSVRDYERSRGSKGGDARGASERHSYGRNHDYHPKSDDHSYNRRHGGNDDWNSQRYSSRSGRDSRGGARSEYSKRDSDYERLSRDDRWNADRGSRERGVDEGSRKRKEMEKDRDRDSRGRDYYKNMDRDWCLERSKTGSRHSNADMDIDEEKPRDRDAARDLVRDKDRDKRRDRADNRDVGDNRVEHAWSRDEGRRHDKDVTGDRDTARTRTREKHKSEEKDYDMQKQEKLQHRKRDDVRERDRYKERHVRESDQYSQSESKASIIDRDKDDKKEEYGNRYQNEDEGRKEQEPRHVSEKVSRNAGDGKHQDDVANRDGRKTKLFVHHVPEVETYHLNEVNCNVSDSGQLQGKTSVLINDEKSAKSTKSSKQEPEVKGLLEPACSTVREAEAAHDLNVAKLAAMKAAELVNKNLGVAGCMSADQKKKLLWGSKKSAPPEESSNRWDMAHFADPDRQEKFNKLMSLSVPCYIWPIVGCQGRFQNGPEGRRQRWQITLCREAKGIAAGFGKAVHSWVEAQGWSDCWIRFIGILVSYVPTVTICMLCFSCLEDKGFEEFLVIMLYARSLASGSDRYLGFSFCFALNCYLHYAFSSLPQCSGLFVEA